MMTEMLATLLGEAFETAEKVKNDVPRQLKFPQAENIIKVAIGMRRSGKTYFLYQIIISYYCLESRNNKSY